jgi:hypothetical protein
MVARRSPPLVADGNPEASIGVELEGDLLAEVMRVELEEVAEHLRVPSLDDHDFHGRTLLRQAAKL